MKVFVSHSSEDEPFASKISKDLRIKAGIDAWLDQWEINPGDKIPERIENGLKEAEVFLFIPSTGGENAQWMEYERQAWITLQIEEEKVAKKENRSPKRRLIPLLYKNCEIPTFISIFRHIEITNDNDETYTQKFQELVEVIKNKKSIFKPDISLKEISSLSPNLIGDPIQRKHLFTILKYILPAYFQTICFEYDTSCLSHIPDNISQVEKSIKLIEYAEQIDKQNLNNLSKVIHKVINGLGKTSTSIESNLFQDLIQLTSEQFDKVLSAFPDTIPFIRSKEAPLASRALDLVIDLKNKKKLVLLKKIITDITPILVDMTISEKHYNKVINEIYPKLNIVDTILAGIAHQKTEEENIIDTQISISSKNIHNKKDKVSIYDAVKKLWTDNNRCHCILIGDGGMGKTTSLLKLWENIVSNNKTSIPIFLRLEKYNQTSNNEKREFIWYRIFNEYLDKFPDDEEIINLKNKFKYRNDNHPSAILILDGFNEITTDFRELLLCLNEIRSTLKGIQIIISSRYDMRKNFNWNDFEILNLEPLEDQQIQDYINLKLGKDSFNQELIQNIPILRNPMMLSLYCGLERELKISIGKEDYDFIPKPRYKAEILHNFVISSLARLDKTEGEINKTLNRLNLRHIIPRIGYEMEKKGLYEIEYKNLVDIIFNELQHFWSIDFIKSYPSLVEHINDYIITCIEPKNPYNVVKVIKNLKEKYGLLKKLEEKNYSFIHQDFRDYFAAIHIKEKIQDDVENGNKKFSELSSRIFRIHLRNMLGELIGEPRRKPIINETCQPGEIKETIMDKCLKLLRHERMEENDYRILNIIETLKSKRVDISNTDLSYIDLYNIVLNNTILGHRHIDGKYSSVILRGSRVKGCNFLSNGHYELINCVVYNSNGTNFFSCGNDYTIKEWNSITGECIRSYEGHAGFISSLSFRDNKLISGSWDKRIREWNILTGKCIKIYTGHNGVITSVAYNHNGEKFISGSEDKTIKEWDVKTGNCIGTYNEHTDTVNSVNYSPDERKFISGSHDNTIKEWDIKNGNCIRTYKGHKEWVYSVCYNSQGDKIISGSDDDTIKEWDIKNGNCIRTYEGHNCVNVVTYNPDGTKILSGSYDKTIKEWDTLTGQCLKTYSGHNNEISSISYNPDGTKILSGSYDKTIKEWDTLTGQCLKTYYGYYERFSCVIYNLDGSKIFAGTNNGLIKEWDISSLRLIKIYKGHNGKINSICISNGNDKIITSSDDKLIKEWNIETGQCIQTYIQDGHNKPVRFAIYSPDSNKILSGSEDKTLKEWNTSNGKCINTYKGHSKTIVCGIYILNGSRIIAGSLDNNLKGWETGNKCSIRWYGQYSSNSNIDYNPEIKKFICTAIDNTIKERNMSSKAPSSVYKGNSSNIIFIKYIKKSKNINIISVSKDGTIQEFDRSSGKLTSYKLNCIKISSIDYNYKMNRLVYIDGDNTIKEIDLTNNICKFIKNMQNLFIQGVDMQDLHPDSKITEDEKEILRQYGAII